MPCVQTGLYPQSAYKDTRGRCGEEIVHLLKVGIQNSGNNPHVLQIDDETEALEYTITVYNDNTLIFFGVEDIDGVLNYMKKLQGSIEAGAAVQEQVPVQSLCCKVYYYCYYLRLLITIQQDSGLHISWPLSCFYSKTKPILGQHSNNIFDHGINLHESR